ncbi:MAG: YdcF family protein [Bacteroidota bacterium]|nr:YdcF family protein [Bacteroidota bacterium]
MKLNRKLIRIALIIALSGIAYSVPKLIYEFWYVPLEHLRKNATAGSLDVIIVPGIPYDGTNWGRIMKWRVHWSVLLYKNGLTKNIIYSGSAVYTPYSESMIMAMYAEKMGVPAEHIFIENKAEHTTENLYYSWELAKKYKMKRIAFATDPFQSYKIAPYIKELKLDVSLLPMVLPLMDKINMKDYEIDSRKAYTLKFISIEERLSPEERDFHSRGGRIRHEK